MSVIDVYGSYKLETLSIKEIALLPLTKAKSSSDVPLEFTRQSTSVIVPVSSL